MHHKKSHERKWQLAARLLTGELTPAEQAEWDTFKNDTQFQQEFELVKQHWHTLGTLPYGQIDTAHDWQLVLEKIRQRAGGRRHAPVRVQVWRYAAVVTALALVTVLVWMGIRLQMAATDDTIATVIEAPPGSKTVVTLPDSSSVWLNAGSRISFNKDFGKESRDVTLQGEAFFDVKKKEALKFRVQTAVFNITVLGTAFNVRAYPEDDVASATLVRGSLKVNRANAAGERDAVMLKPNEKLVMGKPGGTAPDVVVETKIDAALETAWKDGWLTVRGESLNELAKKIERLYDVKIRFEDEALKTYRYTGRIQQFSLEQVLKALALTSPIEFVINEKSVTLRENEAMRSKYRSLQTP